MIANHIWTKECIEYMPENHFNILKNLFFNY
jgi:hypothetical protein